jgi:hypothetical protein
MSRAARKATIWTIGVCAWFVAMVLTPPPWVLLLIIGPLIPIMWCGFYLMAGGGCDEK